MLSAGYTQTRRKDRDWWKPFAIGGAITVLIFAVAYRWATYPRARPIVYEHIVPTKADRQASAARQLSADQVAGLEAQVAKQPDDLESRAKLLAFYSSGYYPAETRRHMLWMIRTHPEGIMVWDKRFTPMMDATLDPEGYAQGCKLWLARLTRHNIPDAELENAARYFRFADNVISQKLLLRERVHDDAAGFGLGEEYYAQLAAGPAWQWAKPFGETDGKVSIRVTIQPGKL